jgi:hypothetical protein
MAENHGGIVPPGQKSKKTGGDDGGGGAAVGIPAGADQDERPILKHRIDFLRGELAKSRLPADYEFSFNPASMVGSWFHRLENDEIIWQGAVVAEPKPGTYLVQIEQLEPGAKNVQRLIPIEQMTCDDEGYDWRFYDTHDEALMAYAAWLSTERSTE